MKCYSSADKTYCIKLLNNTSATRVNFRLFWIILKTITSETSREILHKQLVFQLYGLSGQQCHISRNLEMPPHLMREMRRLLLEMWMWVRGMRISIGDDTSPMRNNRISGKRCRVSRERCGISWGRFARISKFRDMWHYSIFVPKLIFFS